MVASFIPDLYPAPDAGASARIESAGASFAGRHSLSPRSPMDQRIVENPQRARSGRKPGVVRYVLAVSLVLVVILFLVAYTISV
jgi:hypothetical protein